jgi:hypothetical protein
MPTLATAEKATKARKLPKKYCNMLRRLGLAKLALWRIKEDLLALDEQRMKIAVKLQTTEVGSEKEDALLIYDANLLNRRSELEKRRDRLSRQILHRTLDSLTDEEHAWARRMQPMDVRIHIPQHLHYWLGTTWKSSIGYERVSGGQFDQNGHMLWRINTGFYFDLEVPQEFYWKPFALNALCSHKDVELEVFGRDITGEI